LCFGQRFVEAIETFFITMALNIFKSTLDFSSSPIPVKPIVTIGASSGRRLLAAVPRPAKPIAPNMPRRSSTRSSKAPVVGRRMTAAAKEFTPSWMQPTRPLLSAQNVERSCVRAAPRAQSIFNLEDFEDATGSDIGIDSRHSDSKCNNSMSSVTDVALRVKRVFEWADDSDVEETASQTVSTASASSRTACFDDVDSEQTASIAGESDEETAVPRTAKQEQWHAFSSSSAVAASVHAAPSILLATSSRADEMLYSFQ